MPKKEKDKDKNFESYLKELEQTVEKLESGEIDLEEAIKDYQNGMELIAKCREILKETKLKIEVLRKKAKGGFEAEEFEDEEEKDAEDEEEEKDDKGEKKDKDDDGELPF